MNHRRDRTMDKAIMGFSLRPPRIKPAGILAAAITTAYCIIYRDLLLVRTTFSGDATMWYGTFHFYMENLQNGTFPYWDPYSIMGTPFYPNISGYGLLDPAVLIGVAAVKWLPVHPVAAFTWLRLYRIFFFISGSFLLYRRTTRHNTSSVLAAGLLLFVVTGQNIIQPMMDYCYSIPLSMYLLLRLFDDLDTQQRYRHAVLLALVSGVTMNIFIPALYVFNLVIFVCLLFLFRCYDFRRTLGLIAERKTALCLAGCLVLVVMMMAPPLSVSLFDTTDSGELFPLTKMTASNNGRFKQMSASELGGDLFFDSLRKDSGFFLGPENYLSLAWPDLSTFFKNRSLVTNIHPVWLYTGSLSFVLVLAGPFVTRQRFFALALVSAGILCVISLNLTGVEGEYSTLQRMFNMLFPPLRMMDTRLNFASLISFYWMLAVCMVLSELLRSGLKHWEQKHYWMVILICLLLTAFKFAITGVWTGKPVIDGPDTVSSLVPLVFVVCIVLARSGIVSARTAGVCLLILMLTDSSAAASQAAEKIEQSAAFIRLIDNRTDYRTISRKTGKREYRDFSYFRVPHVPPEIGQIPAFAAPLMQIKTAVIASKYSHIFTTRRYYDLFSLFPLEKQFALDGIQFPLVRFYRLDRIIQGDDRNDALEYLLRQDAEAIGEHLYLETVPEKTGRPRASRNLAGYPDLLWPGTGYLENLFSGMLPAIMNNRGRIDEYLENENATLSTGTLTANSVTISVENRVPGYLAYTDGWSKYWRAYDHDQEIPVRPANYNSKAVFLPPGKHEVRFVFDPRHYKTGLVLYYAGLVLTSGMVIYLALRDFISDPKKVDRGT